MVFIEISIFNCFTACWSSASVDNNAKEFIKFVMTIIFDDKFIQLNKKLSN